jgi:hypothetical protein
MDTNKKLIEVATWLPLEIHEIRLKIILIN